MAFKIFDEVVKTGDDFFRVDDFKLSEFTKVLPVAIFLIGNNECGAGIFFHFLVLGEEGLIDNFSYILEALVDDGCDAAQVRSDEVVLFAVLEDVSD